MKKRIFFLDTETSGFYRKPSDNPKKDPWIVELAVLVYDVDQEGNAEEVEVLHTLVKPEGRWIHPAAKELHGISTERANKEGLFEKDIALKVDELLKDADVLCCHSVDFDYKFLFDLLARHNQGSALYKLSTMEHICTMKSSTDFCALPHKTPQSRKKGQTFKWPKLEELYAKLFEETFENAHCALDDTKATIRCFLELLKLGIIKVEAFNEGE